MDTTRGQKIRESRQATLARRNKDIRERYKDLKNEIVKVQNHQMYLSTEQIIQILMEEFYLSEPSINKILFTV